METILWIGLGSYVVVGVVLLLAGLITMLRNAGRH